MCTNRCDNVFPVVKQMLGVQVPLARKRSYTYSEILDDLIKTDGGQSEISGVKASDGQDRDGLARWLLLFNNFFSRLSYQEWEGALRFFHNLTFFRTISIDRTAVLVLPNKHYYGQKSQNIRWYMDCRIQFRNVWYAVEIKMSIVWFCAQW